MLASNRANARESVSDEEIERGRGGRREGRGSGRIEEELVEVLLTHSSRMLFMSSVKNFFLPSWSN